MLVVLDFDGTVVESDPYVRLAEAAGRGDDVAAEIDRMAAEDIPFDEGMRSIAGNLEGLPDAAVESAYDHLHVRDRTPELLAALHEEDHRVAIISDGPRAAVRSVLSADELDVDEVVANHLPTTNGALTGSIEGPLLGTTKDEALKRLATEEGRPLGDTLAVGDDRRDLPMLQAAGTGVGLDPDPVVRAEADFSVSTVERLEDRLAEHDIV